jgi:hypothetical protein
MNYRYSENIQARPEVYPAYERSNNTRSWAVLEEGVEAVKSWYHWR